jgi:hypothetical protein
MLLNDFIEENKNLIRKQNGNTIIGDEALVTYFKRAYMHLQKDKTLFTSKINVTTIADTETYELDENCKDVLYLYIGTKEYEKKRIDEFWEEYPFQSSAIFAFDNNTLYISPKPAEGLTITVFCELIKEVETNSESDLAFTVPILYKEALRYLFLAKVHEETPSKEFGDLAMHYAGLYKQELLEAIKSTKVKYRNLQSDYKTI